jgi:hypothetical protein
VRVRAGLRGGSLRDGRRRGLHAAEHDVRRGVRGPLYRPGQLWQLRRGVWWRAVLFVLALPRAVPGRNDGVQRRVSLHAVGSGQLRRLRQPLSRRPGLRQRGVRARLPRRHDQLRSPVRAYHGRSEALRRLRPALRRRSSVHEQRVHGLPGRSLAVRRGVCGPEHRRQQLRDVRRAVCGRTEVLGRSVSVARVARARDRHAAERAVSHIVSSPSSLRCG